MKSLDSVPIVDVNNCFERVDDLGLGRQIFMVVKSIDNQNKPLRNAETGLRCNTEEGLVGLVRLENAGSKIFPWIIYCNEPRGIDRRGDCLVIASVDSLLVFKNGVFWKTIRNKKFRNLHNVIFSKKSGRLLIASTGIDSILELNLISELITWEWNAKQQTD